MKKIIIITLLISSMVQAQDYSNDYNDQNHDYYEQQNADTLIKINRNLDQLNHNVQNQQTMDTLNQVNNDLDRRAQERKEESRRIVESFSRK